jgi:hypothetical protein
MVTTWWLLQRVSPWISMKLLRVKLKLAPCKKTLKLMLTLMLKELRCEGAEFTTLERIFCKDFSAHLRDQTFHDMERVSLWISFMILILALLHSFMCII